MKAAVLCNGPSRTSYQTSLEYDFLVGCNIPWTDVDALVILDEEIINLWAKDPDLIIVPENSVFFARRAYMYTDEIKKRAFFDPYLRKLVDVHGPYHSSGHVAAEQAILEGYTELDIYGCDSWFESSLKSSTHEWVDTSSENLMMCVTSWRTRWDIMIQNNPNVKINFIR